MPTFASDWIAETRQYLYGAERQQLNALSADVDAVTTQIVLGHDLTGNVAGGHIVTVDLEVMYVWDVDQAARTLTVVRGWRGSTATSHSAGSLMMINPRFSDFEIFKALNRDLLDLSSPVNGIYQVRNIDLAAVSGREGYDFPAAGFISIADIQWQVPNTQTQEWRRLDGYEVSTVLPTSAFPSGTGLFLGGMLPTAQQDIRVRYRAALNPLTALTDDVVTVTGIPTTATDLPPLGAALSITAGRPIARSQYDTQGDTRRAAEVSTSDVLQAPAALRQLRQTRVAAEAARLSQQWPARTRPRVQVRGVR